MLLKLKVVGRWGRAGSRSQESGVRSQNEEHLLTADCFLPSVFCFLPSTDCIWGTAARARNPPPWGLSPGILFGLICFETNCRLSRRLEEESLSSRWG